MEYSTDLFDAATVDRMLAHYVVLLEEIIAHPDHPIVGLRMLTQEERMQVLVEWNTTAGNDLATVLDGPDLDEPDELDSFLHELPSLEVATHE